jgi:hypothetical protein
LRKGEKAGLRLEAAELIENGRIDLRMGHQDRAKEDDDGRKTNDAVHECSL